MVKLNKYMKQYEAACSQFEAANIEYLEESVSGYVVTFKLTKSEISTKALVNCASENLDKEVENIIASLEKLISWNEAEKAKAAKKAKKK